MSAHKKFQLKAQNYELAVNRFMHLRMTAMHKHLRHKTRVDHELDAKLNCERNSEESINCGFMHAMIASLGDCNGLSDATIFSQYQFCAQVFTILSHFLFTSNLI